MDRKDRGGAGSWAMEMGRLGWGGGQWGGGGGEGGQEGGDREWEMVGWPVGRGDCEGAMGRGRWGGRLREGGDGEVGYGKREVGRGKKWRGVEGTRGGRISQIDMEYLGEADRMHGQQRLWHSLIATSTWNACVE